MFGIGSIELLVLLLLVMLAAVALVKVVGAGRRVPPSPESRLVGATRTAGLVLGAGLGWWLLGQGSYFSGPMLVPAAIGLGLLVGVALGETVVRPRRGTSPRSASLRPRRIRDYLPPVLTGAIAVQLVVLVALLALTTLTADRDPYTDTVRALACSAGGAGAVHTPYPGSFYSIPLAVAVVLVLGVAALAARQVVRRPRGAGPVEADDALRRRSAGVVVAATGFALAAPYVGIAVTAGLALQGLGDATPSCAAGWTGPVGVAVSLSTLPAAALVVCCVVLLLAGRAHLPAGPRQPHDAVGSR